MTLPACLKSKPDIRLCGSINDQMYKDFQQQLDTACEKNSPVVFELTTLGGDAEIARRIALDLRTSRENGKDMLFLGKTIVYSAGITIMAAFNPANRFITRDTVLLIHERRLEKQVDLHGQPLKACIQMIQQLTAQVELAQALEMENFQNLAQGTNLDVEELYQRAVNNWYIRAEDALGHGLVAGLV